MTGVVDRQDDFLNDPVDRVHSPQGHGDLASVEFAFGDGAERVRNHHASTEHFSTNLQPSVVGNHPDTPLPFGYRAGTGGEPGSIPSHSKAGAPLLADAGGALQGEW